jgi:molybdopterin-guanine dinucleotide biosynthesis protein A
MRVAAFVLAGGVSRRMGRNKALLPFAGGTLIEHVAAQALDAAGNVTIVGRPQDYAALGLRVLGEDFPGCGPLSGIEAALRDAKEGWALVLACDMPGVTAAWLRCLIARTGASGGHVIATSGRGERVEPLCALYHARLHSDVRKALEEGRFAVRDLLPRWSVEPVRPPGQAIVGNINTPEEWAAWSR